MASQGGGGGGVVGGVGVSATTHQPPSNPLPSFEKINALTDLATISNLFSETLAHERVVLQELQAFLKTKDYLEAKLEVIEVLPTKLKPIYTKGKELHETIETTCGLAESVSRKVKDLDVTRERVKETKKRVMDIIDIKNCIDGVKKAMQHQDYETAAGHVNRYRQYLNLDSAVLEEGSARQLRAAEERLKDLVREKLELALAEDNQDNLIRFCKLYTPLGMEEEGLARYGDYIRKIAQIYYTEASDHLKEGLAKSPQGGEEEKACIESVTKLFEGMASIIEDQEPVAQEHFGRESPLFVITVLQTRCDVHAIELFNKIFSHFNLNNIVKEVNQLKDGGGKRERRDPRTLSGVLDMLSILSQRIELYERFVKKRATIIQEQLQKKTAPGSPSVMGSSRAKGDELSKRESEFLSNFNVNKIISTSQLTRVKQEMISQYLLLEEYFMTESVRKAFRMDQDSGDGLTSSIVDHVFFILQKSTRRAMGTANVNGACAIQNILNNCLNLDYKEVLQTMLSDKAEEHSESNRTDEKASYMIVLNDMEVSSEYILKLKAELEIECERGFGSVPTEKDKVKTCLLDLLQTSKTFKQVLQGNLEQVATTIMPRLRSVIDLFLGVNYVLTEVTFAENEINDPFVERFTSGLDAVLQTFRPNLTETNFDALLHIIIQHIANRLEKHLLQKKFNQLGGLQFDKDLRVLMTYFSNNTQRTVRGEFARLTQMASLLNLEKVSEVLEYWGDKSGHMTWRLTPAEVRKVLSRRIDFKPEDIASLQL